MSHTRLWTSAVIIALVVIVGFVLSVPHTRDAGLTSSLSVTTEVPVVTLRDVFKKGVHTITGSVTAPNVCTIISAEATLSTDASGAQSILVAVSLPEDAGTCLQVPTKMNFQTSVSAPAQLPFTATVNGSAATTTVS